LRCIFPLFKTFALGEYIDMTELTDPKTARTHHPLTPIAFEILLAIGDGERHGYAVMQDVEHRTDGRLSLHPGTLYRAMDRLVKSGLLEELEERPDPEMDDQRRRAYFRMTSYGRHVARAEAERLMGQLDTARAKNLLPGGP
jgi:DNA-binding PadR family transcriptional regulator